MPYFQPVTFHHEEEECLAIATHQVSSRRCWVTAVHRRECLCLRSQDARFTHDEQSSGSGEKKRRSNHAGHASWDKTKGQPCSQFSRVESQAMATLHRDMSGQSSVGPREALLRSWIQFHGQWFGGPDQPMSIPPFPLTVLKLHAVGAMLKARVQVTSKLLQPRQGGTRCTRFSVVRCTTLRRA